MHATNCYPDQVNWAALLPRPVSELENMPKCTSKDLDELRTAFSKRAGGGSSYKAICCLDKPKKFVLLIMENRHFSSVEYYMLDDLIFKVDQFSTQIFKNANTTKPIPNQVDPSVWLEHRILAIRNMFAYTSEIQITTFTSTLKVYARSKSIYGTAYRADIEDKFIVCTVSNNQVLTNCYSTLDKMIQYVDHLQGKGYRMFLDLKD